MCVCIRRNLGMSGMGGPEIQIALPWQDQLLVYFIPNELFLAICSHTGLLPFCIVLALGAHYVLFVRIIDRI
jgi:hypothetical protein